MGRRGGEFRPRPDSRADKQYLLDYLTLVIVTLFVTSLCPEIGVPLRLQFLQRHFQPFEIELIHRQLPAMHQMTGMLVRCILWNEFLTIEGDEHLVG